MPTCRYHFSAEVGGTETRGGVELFTLHVCGNREDGRTDENHGRVCSTVWLVHVARDLDYLRVAGGASFAFLLFGLLAGLTALYATLKRRSDTLNQFAKGLSCLKHHSVCIGLHGAAFLFYLISFSVYAGVLSEKFDEDDFAAIVTGRALDSDGFGEGFFLVVVCCIFSLLAGVLVYYFPNEGEGNSGTKDEAMTPAPAGAQQTGPAHSGNGGAESDGDPEDGHEPVNRRVPEI